MRGGEVFTRDMPTTSFQRTPTSAECGPLNSNLQPAFLTSFLLQPAMHRTQRGFLASGCSTYCEVRLHAPQVENSTDHGTSLPSQLKLVRYAG